MADKNNTNTDVDIGKVVKNMLESSPYLKGAYKEAQKKGSEDFAQASQQEGGQQANEKLIQQLIQLTTTTFDIPGTKAGHSAAIGDFLTGKGFDPDRPRQFQLKGSTALKLMQMQQDQAGVPREQTESDLGIIKDLLKIRESTRSPEERARLKESDAAATARGTMAGKKEVASEELSANIQDYKTVLASIPAGKGLDRFQAGLSAWKKSFSQADDVGIAAAYLEDMNKKLRVNVARINDVGNLNENEQEAAERLLVGLFDSEGLREVKVAFLDNLTTAALKRDPVRIRAILKKWQKNPQFKQASKENVSKDMMKAKSLRANEIAKTNPNMSRADIIASVNKEMGR